MIRTFLASTLLLISLGAQAPATTPGLEGTWAGSMKMGDTTDQITVSLHKDGDSWTCTIASANRAPGGVPCTLTSPVNPVTFDVPIVSAHFSGTLSGDTLNGTYTEGIDSPMNLTRVKDAAPATP